MKHKKNEYNKMIIFFILLLSSIFISIYGISSLYMSKNNTFCKNYFNGKICVEYKDIVTMDELCLNNRGITYKSYINPLNSSCPKNTIIYNNKTQIIYKYGIDKYEKTKYMVI